MDVVTRVRLHSQNSKCKNLQEHADRRRILCLSAFFGTGLVSKFEPWQEFHQWVIFERGIVVRRWRIVNLGKFHHDVTRPELPDWWIMVAKSNLQIIIKSIPWLPCCWIIHDHDTSCMYERIWTSPYTPAPNWAGSDVKALQVWLLNDQGKNGAKITMHSCCKRFLIHLSLCIGNTKDELRLDECVCVACGDVDRIW